MAFLGIHILSSKQLEAVKAEAAGFAVSEAGKAVAVLKQTSIGSIVAKDIAAMQDKNLSGAQKFSTVVANTAPLVLKYATAGGLVAVLADVEDIARSLVQSVYNDTKSTTAGRVAAAVLKRFGIAV